MYTTYPKGSKAPNQNVDTQQEIGRDRFVPGGMQSKDGGVGPASGKTSYPPTKKHVTLSTQKHHATMAPKFAKGGGDAQVSCTAPKGRTKFGTEKHCGKDKFVPDEKSDYGVGGV